MTVQAGELRTRSSSPKLSYSREMEVHSSPGELLVEYTVTETDESPLDTGALEEMVQEARRTIFFAVSWGFLEVKGFFPHREGGCGILVLAGSMQAQREKVASKGSRPAPSLPSLRSPPSSATTSTATATATPTAPQAKLMHL